MKRATVFLVLSAVVFLLGGGFAFMLFSSLGEKSGEIKRLRAEARDPQELEAELDTAKKQWEEHGIQLAHLERGIPEVAYVPTMLKELEAYGNASGVKVFGVRPFIAAEPSDKSGKKKKKKDKPYTELTIEIKGKGKYRSVMNFVKAMTRFPKIVAVRTVALAPKNDPTIEASTLEVTLELRAFLFKPENGEEAPFPVETPKSAETPETKPGSPSNPPANGAGAKPTALAAPKGGIS